MPQKMRAGIVGGWLSDKATCLEGRNIAICVVVWLGQVLWFNNLMVVTVLDYIYIYISNHIAFPQSQVLSVHTLNKKSSPTKNYFKL